MLRPSLSGNIESEADENALIQAILVQCVAGVDAPAFVERGCLLDATYSTPCVAGVDAPAFVERRSKAPLPRCHRAGVAGALSTC